MGILSVDMMGGLGNQLFQIAVAYAYAKQHGLDLVFSDTWDHKAGREPLWNYYFATMPMPWTILPKHQYTSYTWHRVSESGFLYAPLNIPPGYSEYLLYGFFQSSQYFGQYADEIRSILQIEKCHLTKAQETLALNGIKEPDGWIVAHVRRGDYLAMAHVHVVTDENYFKRARAEIAKQIGPRTVCWISEDLDWVYKNVYEQGDVVMNSDTMTDFACLSLFRHVIMSNSTYSWWATWLNPKSYEISTRVICCPDRWFGPAGHQDVETIFEPGWVRIETTSG